MEIAGDSISRLVEHQHDPRGGHAGGSEAAHDLRHAEHLREALMTSRRATANRLLRAIADLGSRGEAGTLRLLVRRVLPVGVSAANPMTGNPLASQAYCDFISSSQACPPLDLRSPMATTACSACC